MQQPFNILATRTGKTFGRLGSFWSSTFGDPANARNLVNLAHQLPSLGRYLATLNNLAGSDQGAELVTNFLTFYTWEEIDAAGDIFYDEYGRLYGQDFQPGLDVYGGGNTPLWILPVKTVVPYAIQTTERKLLAGIDFWTYQDRFILLRQNPDELFSNRRYLITRGRRKYISYLARAAQAPLHGPIDQVLKYERSDQSLKQLRLALCQLAGLAILPGTQRLLDVNTSRPGEVLYTFEQDVLRIPYPHVLLTEGQVYPANTVIGPGIQVYYGADDTAWWRQINWKGGLSLDPLLQVKGLHLFDANLPAYGVGQDDATDPGTIHARFKLGPDFWQEQPFWNEVSRRETLQTKYLNGAIGLATPDTEAFNALMDYLSAQRQLALSNHRLVEQPDFGGLSHGRLVNPLDVFFESILQPRVVVVTVDEGVVLKPEPVFRFLRENAPLGITLLVFVYGPALTPFTFDLSRCPAHYVTVFTGTGFISSAPASAPTPSYNLNQPGKRVDFVTIKQETRRN